MFSVPPCACLHRTPIWTSPTVNTKLNTGINLAHSNQRLQILENYEWTFLVTLLHFTWFHQQTDIDIEILFTMRQLARTCVSWEAGRYWCWWPDPVRPLTSDSTLEMAPLNWATHRNVQFDVVLVVSLKASSLHFSARVYVNTTATSSVWRPENREKLLHK